MKKIYFLSVLLILCLLSRAQEAKRIVSLVPWMTKSLYLMGEQSRIVGCTSFCPVNPADKIPVVASAMSINVEKTMMLKPDLVLASSLIKPEIIDKLKNLGIKVSYQPYPKSFEEICSSFVRLGELVGQGTKARQIVSVQKERLSKLMAKVPKDKKPKVLIQIGAKPLFAAIPNTAIDDFIRFSGGTNVAAGLQSGDITREYILKQNPDVIFVVTMGIVAQEEKNIWMSYPVISATKSKKIFILDSDKTCSPTPILFVDALEEIIKQMYQ